MDVYQHQCLYLVMCQGGLTWQGWGKDVAGGADGSGGGGHDGFGGGDMKGRAYVVGVGVGVGMWQEEEMGQGWWS